MININIKKVNIFFGVLIFWVISLFTSLFCMQNPICNQAASPKHGAKIILVLGISSSGKSTICHRLASCFSVGYVLSMDNLSDEFDQGISKEERLKFPKEWVSSELCIFCKNILIKSNSCNVMIIDAMLQESKSDLQIDQTESFIKYLNERGLQIYSLLVHCPISQLCVNVSKRNCDFSELNRRSQIAVAEAYIETYLYSPPHSPRRPMSASLDGEITASTGSPREIVEPEDIDRLLTMMQIDRALRKKTSFELLKAASSERIPLPVMVTYEHYNFVFHNNSPTVFESEFSRLIKELAEWLVE